MCKFLVSLYVVNFRHFLKSLCLRAIMQVVYQHRNEKSHTSSLCRDTFAPLSVGKKMFFFLLFLWALVCQSVTSFKWANQSWEWNPLLCLCVTAVGADLLTSTPENPRRLILSQIFRSSRVFPSPKQTFCWVKCIGLYGTVGFIAIRFDERAICGVTSG